MLALDIPRGARETVVGLLSGGQRQRFQLFGGGFSQCTGLVSDVVLCRSLANSWNTRQPRKEMVTVDNGRHQASGQ